MKDTKTLCEGVVSEIVYLRCYERDLNIEYKFLDIIQNSKIPNLREVKDTDHKEYCAGLEQATKSLSREVATISNGFDTIFAPQSSRDILAPYMERLRSYYKCLDISDRFERKDESIKAAESSITSQELSQNVEYSIAGDEQSLNDILMVDDCVSRGATAKAYLSKLIDAGVRSKGLRFVIAAPLYIPDNRGQSSQLMDAIKAVRHAGTAKS